MRARFLLNSNKMIENIKFEKNCKSPQRQPISEIKPKSNWRKSKLGPPIRAREKVPIRGFGRYGDGISPCHRKTETIILELIVVEPIKENQFKILF